MQCAATSMFATELHRSGSMRESMAFATSHIAATVVPYRRTHRLQSMQSTKSRALPWWAVINLDTDPPSSILAAGGAQPGSDVRSFLSRPPSAARRPAGSVRPAHFDIPALCRLRMRRSATLINLQKNTRKRYLLAKSFSWMIDRETDDSRTGGQTDRRTDGRTTRRTKRQT